MKKHFLSLNLQRFAEPAETDPVVNEPVVDEPVVDEPTDEPVVDDEPQDEPVDEPVKPSDHVPLTKYMAEKKKRQELERMLADQSTEREKLNVTQQYIDRGYPEFEAKNLADRDVSHKRELETLKSRFQDTEIKDLARSNEFYSDAEAFTDEIKDKMKSLNISAKEAYMLLRGEVRTYEMRTKQEQLSAARRKTTAKTPQTAKPASPNSPYKLDETDLKALAGLQKAMPDAGWTPQKYFETVKQT